MKLSQLAKELGLEFTGQDAEFVGLNTLENAGPDEVSFLANPKYTHFLETTRALAVIVAPEHAPLVTNALISKQPYFDFARAGSFFAKKQGEFTGISPLASIDATAEIGKGCTIYPYVFIGPRAKLGDNCEIFPGTYIGEDCLIGDGCILYPHTAIMAGVTLGNNCVVKAGVSIGADGFGYVRTPMGMQKIPQIGSVVVHDNVHIGANTCIDKATLGATTVQSDTKIDNLVQIAHNVHIGSDCLIISQVGIAGSTHLGDRVTLAGQVGLAGHLKIGDDAIVGPQAGVHSDIAPGVRGSGSPFIEEKQYRRAAIISMQLPDLLKRIRTLEAELKQMKTLLSDAGKEE